MGANYEKLKTVSRSEIVNSTARLSPLQDFMQRTMSSIQGVWAKLNYIRELRRDDGGYEHWGFSQIHGEAACQQTIADVHSELALELLRTPIPELSEEVKTCAENIGTSDMQLAEGLYRDERRLTPRDLRGGSRKHIHSVLLAARLLSRQNVHQQNKEESTRDVLRSNDRL